MVFGRRKSSTHIDVQNEAVEAKRRNRLSKPLTNKSSSNLAQLAVADSHIASRNASVEAVVSPISTPPIPSPKLTDDERQQIRDHLFNSNEEPEKTLSKRSSWIGVAALVNKFESNPAMANSSQTSLLQPPKQRGSMTSIFSSRRSSLGVSRPSLSKPSSMDRVHTLASESGRNASSTSIDQAPEPSAPPPRRSSFLPGTATRKASGVDSILEEPQAPPPVPSEIQVEDPIVEEVFDDSDSLSFSEGDDEDWFPPPQEPRSETPQSLDYTHLGGLSLGSLQVVNGRASPATTVASRQLLVQMTGHRDTSSDYGDPEVNEGPPYMLSAYPRTPPTHSREVSWYSQRTSKLQNVEVYELPERVVVEAAAVDLAAAMAAEYIAELPASPYNARQESVEKERVSDSIEEERNSSPQHTLRQSQSLETMSHRSSSPAASLQSETGSVLHITTKKNEIEDELFDDESLSPSRVSTEADRASMDSFHTYHSSPKPEYSRPEAFESAVEFQRFPSPQKSPQRSPVRSSRQSPDIPFRAAVEGYVDTSHKLEIPGGVVQYDSGYSSNNSVRSSSWERRSMMGQHRSQSPLKVEHNPDLSQTQTEPERAPGKLQKPILKTRKTAPAVPIFSDLRPSAPPSVMSTASEIPKLQTEKPKTRKKLQKRSFFGKQKKELFVQSVASVDDLTIPAIPQQARDNLHVRSQHVPELETTYKTQHHIRSQKSMSTMVLPQADLRFPSPEPEPIISPKPRRRSWLPGSKEEKPKPKPKYDSMLSERDAQAIISDFGSVNHYLGHSPYDMAMESAPTPSRSRQNSTSLSPFNVSTKPARPRSMFDDKTAAEIARMRSSSIRERDAWNISRKSSTSSRRSFNDRGGIPGKNLRPASIVGAPPMPPMPSQEVLQRRISGMSYAPPPPPHSPRPIELEAEQIDEPFEAPPPPPPSHSPRPMDISEVEDPWAAQAAAWKARRNSLGEALRRQSYHEFDDTYLSAPVEEEPLYPEIPIRGQSSSYQTQRNYSLAPGTYAHDYEEMNSDFGSASYRRPPPSSYMQSYHHGSPRPHNFSTQPYDPSIPSQSRPLPTPSRGPSIRSQRSAYSNRSHASLAEDLHPEDEETRLHPAPEFGRYSGGMQYGYERQQGFGGSAGTRSVSGKADLGFKGVKLREGWGVDLGDVPVIGVVKAVR